MRAADFITHIQWLLGDPSGDFFSSDKLLRYLNLSIEDVASRSRTLCDWHYVNVQKDRGLYGLPESFLEFKAVFFQYNGHFYPLSPTGMIDAAPAIFRSTPNNAYYPHCYAHAGNAHIEWVVDTVAEGGNSETTFAISTPVTLGVKVGDQIINITDNSEGEISDISNDRQLITFTNLMRGEDNRMQPGDEFRILSRTQHRHAIAISPPPRITDKMGEESLYIYLARTHVNITQANIDNLNDEIELDTEFNTTLRYRVLWYASIEENGVDHPAVQAWDIKYETDYRSAFPKANRKIKEYLYTWRCNSGLARQDRIVKPANASLYRSPNYVIR